MKQHRSLAPNNTSDSTKLVFLHKYTKTRNSHLQSNESSDYQSTSRRQQYQSKIKKGFCNQASTCQSIGIRHEWVLQALFFIAVRLWHIIWHTRLSFIKPIIHVLCPCANFWRVQLQSLQLSLPFVHLSHSNHQLTTKMDTSSMTLVTVHICISCSEREKAAHESRIVEEL